jgi:hypothetical protein
MEKIMEQEIKVISIEDVVKNFNHMIFGLPTFRHYQVEFDEEKNHKIVGGPIEREIDPDVYIHYLSFLELTLPFPREVADKVIRKKIKLEFEPFDIKLAGGVRIKKYSSMEDWVEEDVDSIRMSPELLSLMNQSIGALHFMDRDLSADKDKTALLAWLFPKYKDKLHLRV